MNTHFARWRRSDPRLRGALGRGCLIAGGIGAAFLLVLVVLGTTVSGKYNSLQTARETVRSKFAEIDNQYKRRSDLVPQLVETVKGAANYEKSTLQAVVDARASVGRVQLPENVTSDPDKLAEYMKAQQSLAGALQRLLVVAEQYPDLKANQGFLSLQDNIAGTENRIAVARRDYIDAVRDFNTRLTTFPGNMIGAFFGMHPLPQLESATETERQVPNVHFDFESGQKK